MVLRSKRNGYGLPPVARMSSSFCSRFAFSAISPLPVEASPASAPASWIAVSSLLTTSDRSATDSLRHVAIRFVIIGGGPAGNTAASHAARLGAQVTLIERDVVGGAAHLWDCIPSKTMIATGGAMSFTRRLEGMGLEQQQAEVDVDALTERIESIKRRLGKGTTKLLTSQGVELIHGSARFLSPNEIEVTTSGRRRSRSR